MTKTIQIKCEGAGLVDFHKLVDLQGNLKDRTREQVDKLKRSIIKHGFSAPFFVWVNKKYYTIDGHGRIKALYELEKEGYKIPELPYSLVQAKDKKEAKEKLMAINSSYGRQTEEGLYEFLNEPDFEIELDMDIVETPDLDLDRFVAGYGEEVPEKEPKEKKLMKCPECGYEF